MLTLSLTASEAGPMTGEATGTLVFMVGGCAQFCFSLTSGALYHVEAATNLLDATSWIDITGQLTNWTGEEMNFSDAQSENLPARLYRISSP